MAAESDVLSEIEVLQSIYLDELLVTRTEAGGWDVRLVLYPSTAEDSVSQFVRLTLTLTLDQQYPSSSPHISIQNPRGLSDDKLCSVQKCLQLEAQSCLGSPVLYQLIEKAKEILTESNIPHGNCVICLYGFKEGEVFTKTSCYHYFHSHCLGRYASHSERELRQREKELEEDKTRGRVELHQLTVVCPVCREPLTYEVNQLLSSPPPQLPELDEAAISTDFQHKWRKLQKLLERQRSKGGIIDPEAESNRFLIHINEASLPENGNLDVDVPPAPPAPSVSHVSSGETSMRAETFVPGPSHCRGVLGQRHPSQVRGLRRGGRSRPHHGRSAPIAEQLEKLRLASDCSEGPMKAKPQCQQTPGNAELHQTANDVSTEQQETGPGAAACRSAWDPECVRDSSSGRGHRGRRRSHQRPALPAGALGSSHHHWDGRASRAWGGGSRRGHGRGQQRALERGREEAL
ncbi:E3 ubiquitin-protein ligase RNF25 isoform 2-T2 [Aulostomus maculatus]